MIIDGLATGGGRGRGRGRGRIMIQPTPEVGVTTAAVISEDSVDGCVDRRPTTLDFGIANELSKSTEPVVATIESNEVNYASNASSTNKISSNAEIKAVEVGETDYKIPESLMLPLEGEVPFSVQSVIYEEKRVVVNIGDVVEPCKAVIRLLENELVKKWKQENRMIFENDTLLEKTMLSAMELSDGKTLMANQIKKGDGEHLVITIDVFHPKMGKLRLDFMASLIYGMIPKLPSINSKKVGLITNLREDNGKIVCDVVFNDHTWRGLRDTIHRVQCENSLIGPHCTFLQAFYKELINGFNVQFFLAPLGDNWDQLHRVKTLGFCNDSMVAVRYLDIGKQVDIHIKNLALPILTRSIPELIEKTPPLAVPFCVDKVEPGPLEKTNAIKKMVEGKACYIQMLDDLAKTPVANVYITMGTTGTVSLADIFITHGINAPSVNNDLKPEPLIVVERKMDALSKMWEGNLSKLKKDLDFDSTGHLTCELCSNKPLGKLSTTGSLPGLLGSCNLEE